MAAGAVEIAFRPAFQRVIQRNGHGWHTHHDLVAAIAQVVRAVWIFGVPLMSTVVVVLSILLGLLFLGTGGVKVLSLPQSLAIRDHLGLRPRLWQLIGVCESAGGLGLLAGLVVPLLGVAASIGLVMLMAGAIISRIRVSDSAATISVDVLVLALVAVLVVVRASA
ncbi:DoxX family protein [Nonomuraea sp. NPDC003201]